jgi:hypothetical protein
MKSGFYTESTGATERAEDREPKAEGRMHRDLTWCSRLSSRHVLP